ncbi:phospholipase D-like domain-containing protein [Alkalimarinus coralli]|uniref:phospholipase D-like domain-containing protein n=1 Tax=Alkalimarinus coralli TaxID=2935863 RepID=UPI00202AF519|nr:phospholipase D-like domain-containing protein [Alkalimarinus coralli]
MRHKDLEAQLRETLEDIKLSSDEKVELRKLAPSLSKDERRFLRNKGFDLARASIDADASQTFKVLKWLEQVVKTLDSGALENAVESSAHFSPGDECRRKIIDLCHQAKQSIDICVFTISDDSLSEAIYKAHQRGIKVRIITDNDKSDDLGSDVDDLAAKGVNIRMDQSPNHMHHKFAVFDQAILLNGSFNWTRSASRYNQENVVVSGEVAIVDAFQRKFEALWSLFG